MKKVGFISLGCPKNLVDSEVMLGHLRLRGFEITNRMEEAEILVVNTCGFIEPAKQESIESILEAASMKEKGVCKKLVVTGCLVERYRDQLLQDMPEIDVVMGTRDIEHIVDALAAQDRFWEPERNPRYLYDEHSPRLLTTPQASAYVKISEGCDHACAFCAIPMIRGPQRSRTVASVVTEAQRLVSEGTLEINLVGQDSTDFGRDLGDKDALEKLVLALGEIKGLRWFRIHYSYPSRLTVGLLEAMAATSNCCPYLDMPLQHANASVLKTMGRGSSGAQFQKVLERARRILPDVFIRSNFIVGFPGETEEAFRELRDFIQETRFNHLGVFTYSPEEGTPAYALGDPIPARTKERRKRILMETQQKISLAHHKALVGRTLEVLVEGPHEETPLVFKGRHQGQAPEVDGNVLIVAGEPRANTIQPVKITEAHAYDLVGEGVEIAAKRFEENSLKRT